MGGGVLIESRDDQRRYGRREVADALPDAPLEIGTLLVLDPCVPIPWPDTRARESRPCPRVDLDPENVVAMAMVEVLLSETNRAAFAPFFDATCGWMPDDERARLLSRVINATSSPPVADARRRQAQEAQRRASTPASGKGGRRG